MVGDINLYKAGLFVQMCPSFKTGIANGPQFNIQTGEGVSEYFWKKHFEIDFSLNSLNQI